MNGTLRGEGKLAIVNPKDNYYFYWNSSVYVGRYCMYSNVHLKRFRALMYFTLDPLVTTLGMISHDDRAPLALLSSPSPSRL